MEINPKTSKTKCQWSLTGILGGDERENEAKEIMANSFPKMMANTNPQMQRKDTHSKPTEY